MYFSNGIFVREQTGPIELESAEQTRHNQCFAQPESFVETVLVQVASHAVHVALSATARGHLLLVAPECLRWRVPDNSVSGSSNLLSRSVSIAQVRTRSASASASSCFLNSASHERSVQKETT